MTSTDNRRSSFALKYLATTIAAISAETGECYILNESASSGPYLTIVVTFPLDITKTRLQLQNQLGSKNSPYRGMFRTAIGISECCKIQGKIMI